MARSAAVAFGAPRPIVPAPAAPPAGLFGAPAGLAPPASLSLRDRPVQQAQAMPAVVSGMQKKRGRGDLDRDRERVTQRGGESEWEVVPERPEPSVSSVAIQKEQVVRMVRQAQAQSSFRSGAR